MVLCFLIRHLSVVFCLLSDQHIFSQKSSLCGLQCTNAENFIFV
ncbi:Uncharacterized protein dnm_078390 [Desulfonema magnum]|uniref:Uncharacterized protein n=1 Tax=Desulfonema magnum TaxID=45655 RepID=A0A975BV89_9BACT|nr:Uncharacterized protein dnm_078390 [Desulfonema magnum]